MKSIKYTISGILVLLLFIVLVPTFDWSWNWTYLFFLLGNGLFVYLAYKILKDGEPSEKKFEDGDWYEDC